jgi:hypothetical protein
MLVSAKKVKRMKRAIRVMVQALATGEGAHPQSRKKRGMELLWQPLRCVP